MGGMGTQSQPVDMPAGSVKARSVEHQPINVPQQRGAVAVIRKAYQLIIGIPIVELHCRNDPSATKRGHNIR